MTSEDPFVRSEALLGAEAVSKLSVSHVLVVGVGGVGSWCAEALVRTGVGRLTLIDDDCVAVSNINRQCPALMTTVGRAKVEVMKERLLAINDMATIEARNERFVGGEDFDGIDCIVDAIDSVDCKAELILSATAKGIPIVSSLGAACRTDPTKVVVSRFEKVAGDGLARALRHRFKRMNRFPGKFSCVWSTETPLSCDKGSIMPVTATFGMVLAAEVIRCLTKK